MKLFFMTVILIIAALSLSACITGAVYSNNAEKKYPAEGQILPVNGKDVHVITAGETGPVVLMIHGASANANEFDWSLAPRLSGDHRVLMADRPGHGYSERPKNADTLTVQAAQMAGALEAMAPGEQAVVIGHSFGGGVALRLAVDRPDLVKALVLAAPVTHDWGETDSNWYNALATTPVVGAAFGQLVPIFGPAQGEAGVLGVFDPVAPPEGYYEKSAIPLLFRPSHFRANAYDVENLRTELAAQQGFYPQLDMPIVVFSGSQDTVLNPSLHAKRLKEDAPNVELVILPEEGHMPHHGEGAAMADAIRRLAAAEEVG